MDTIGVRFPGEDDAVAAEMHPLTGQLAAVVQPHIPDPLAAVPGTPTRPRWSYTYLATGDLETVTDPYGRVTTHGYDALGRRTSRTLPKLDPQNASEPPTREIWTHDVLGREATHVDFVGNQTLTRYDDLGRRERVDYYLPGLDPASASPSQSVDYGYDSLGRLVTTVQSSAPVAAGQAPGPSRTVTNGYDQLGRLASVAAPEGVVHYGYDLATGRQTRLWTTPDTSATSPITSDVFYAYDPFGRLATVTTLKQRGVSLPEPIGSQSYYVNDQSVYPGPEITRYYYDAANQLVKTLLPTDVWVLYEYDPQGRIEMLINARDNGPADPTQVVEYDPKNVGLDSRFTYTRDAAGRITAVDELLRRPGLNSAAWDASRVDYVYDALGRLTKETRVISRPDFALDSSVLNDPLLSSSRRRNDYVLDFTLDLAGNRVGQVRKSSTYSGTNNAVESVSYERTTAEFDARDRLLAEFGQSSASASGPWATAFDVVYQYDANGSLESKTRTGTLPETQTYDFDVRNRLAGMTRTTPSAEVKGQYVYDDVGIRTRVRETKTTGSGSTAPVTTTITDYLLDHQSPTGYAQAIEERVATATGTVANPPTVNPPLATAYPSVSYVFGHELITQARRGANDTAIPTTRVYRHDAHSGVRQLAGIHGTSQWITIVYDNYTYDSYGTLVRQNPSPVSGTLNTHLYRGEVWDAGLGMTYLRARYLDHRTGRFVGMDPFEGTLTNPLTFQDFVYAHNDPLGMVDPSGENAVFSVLTSIVSRFVALPILGVAVVVSAYEVARNIAFDVAELASDEVRLDAYHRFLRKLISIGDLYWTGGQQAAAAQFPWLSPASPSMVSSGTGIVGSLFSKQGPTLATNVFPSRWPELRESIQYTMDNYTTMGSFGIDLYDDFHDNSWEFKDGWFTGFGFTESSSNWTWLVPGFNMTAGIFRMKGVTDPYIALSILIHEPMHDTTLGHGYITPSGIDN